ncbi:MAG: hypothetical protein L0241_21220 [Planctomycetia bacterium]|nr:hypothetical protein [Planctomycetia bacterium]
MSRLRLVLLMCGMLSPLSAFGASPDPKDLAVPQQELSKARELVQQLGSEVYREREDAQAELAKMGRLAKQALVDGATNDPDPEIRLRCGRLLPKANADDLKARIETFLADTESKYDHDLPGLKTFRKHIGATPEARALYVELLKSPYNLDLLAAIDKGEVEGGRAISDRRAMLYADMQYRPVVPGGKPFVPKQPTLPDIAVLLFAESLVSSENIPKNSPWVWINGATFLQQNPSMQALNGNGTHAKAYKAIVAQWLATRSEATELTNLSYQLNNNNLKQFKETLPLLRRIVLTDGVQGYAKGQAIMSLVQQRGKDEIPFLKAILKNELRLGDYPGVFVVRPGDPAPDPNKIITLNNDMMVQQVWFQKPNGMAETHTSTLKDVALAFLLNQGGQDLRSYGYEFPPGFVPNPNQLGYGNYAFTSEEKRTAAFVKYGFWQMKESMKEPVPKGKEPAKEPVKEPAKDPVKRPGPDLPPPPPALPPDK